jgi:glycosyltransferase involved in cell wall biosynthesis
MNNSKKILVFATKGKNTNDESRILSLLDSLEIDRFGFDAHNKLLGFWQLIKHVWTNRPSLIVMEGTGIAGGFACLLVRWLLNVPYVVSSGDAVAPFIAMKFNGIVGYIAQLYEQLLCRFCAGFIGWTPYLVGRALTFGAPKGITAAGWSLKNYSSDELDRHQQAMREQLGIPPQAIVYGLVGSLTWVGKLEYCYGVELVKARQKIPHNADVYVIIGGDGTGMPHLQALAGDLLGNKILLTGNIPNDRVMEYLAAMDVASLPQSVDGVGSFRYTTKVSEYWAAKLPIIIGQVPMAYDLLSGWSWCLPGNNPWDDRYISAVARLMETLTPAEIAVKKQHIPTKLKEFNFQHQHEQVTKFIEDILL